MKLLHLHVDRYIFHRGVCFFLRQAGLRQSAIKCYNQSNQSINQAIRQLINHYSRFQDHERTSFFAAGHGDMHFRPLGLIGIEWTVTAIGMLLVCKRYYFTFFIALGIPLCSFPGGPKFEGFIPSPPGSCLEVSEHFVLGLALPPAACRLSSGCAYPRSISAFRGGRRRQINVRVFSRDSNHRTSFDYHQLLGLYYLLYLVTYPSYFLPMGFDHP